MTQTTISKSTTTIRPKSVWEHTLEDMGNTFRMLRRNKAGFIGFIIAAVMIAISFIGPFFFPLDTVNRIDKIYAPPSWEFPLGTDFQGRSIWPQVVQGGQEAMLVGFIAAIISTIISIVLGSFSAYVGGKIDALITTIADIVLTLPIFILLAIVAAVFQPKSVLVLGAILGFLTWPSLLRAIRAQALSIRERDYIEAVRSLGMRRSHIILNEILPNMAGFIIISFIFSVTSAMLLQVNLVGLGLVPISGNNWAITIFQANQKGALYFTSSLAYIMAPVTAIVLFQFALVTMTRSLEEIFNPRLRGNL